MMASSTGVKARVLFLEWLDRVEVGGPQKAQPPHRLAVKAVKTLRLMVAVMLGDQQQAPHLRGHCPLAPGYGGLQSVTGPVET